MKSRAIIACYQACDLLDDADRAVQYRLEKNGFHRSDYLFTTEQIMFVHLPKTGGTSVTRLLANDPLERFAHLGVHKPVSLHCPPKDFRYITVMREPVERVWSQYQMLLRSPAGYPYKKYADRGLETLLKKCWAVRNMNCRYLTGEIGKEPDQQSLNSAMKNLDQFYRVIDFAHFEAGLTELLNEFEIPYDDVPNERQSSYPTPNEKEMALIQSYNQLDIALFNYWQQQKDKEGKQ